MLLNTDSKNSFALTDAFDPGLALARTFSALDIGFGALADFFGRPAPGRAPPRGIFDYLKLAES
ncbi:hypothetical protein A6A04_13405 [Paramagnetospirillum marisnigri]|uniref:Uncharacterized protein n=1 Tax=Paramagnetospirillum marisnigri TaxID=1285242 RepID=A0A178MUK5_9PROT|nr:hypothetical protein A6A04_13405 [Paramagnetospirillum marisnigri]